LVNELPRVLQPGYSIVSLRIGLKQAAHWTGADLAWIPGLLAPSVLHLAVEKGWHGIESSPYFPPNRYIRQDLDANPPTGGTWNPGGFANRDTGWHGHAGS